MVINRTMPKAYVIQIIGEGVTPPFDGQNFVMEPTQWEEAKKVIDEYYQSGEWHFDNLKAQAKLEEEIASNERVSGCKVKTPPKKGCVYFVKAEGLGVKIGFTTNLESRMKSLQTASPHELELLDFIRGVYVSQEDAAHEFFKDKKLRGEWFDIKHWEVVDYISSRFVRGE